jgi:YfiH family protein
MHRLPETLPLDWPAPRGVQGLITTRMLGDVKDAGVRAKLGVLLPAAPAWLRQVHGTVVVDAASVVPGAPPAADAACTRERGVVCAVMAGDCMPVLLAAADGSVVGAAHAGWRGLADGVIERTIEAMGVPGEALVAFLGPAIGPKAYEVGAEVRDAFLARDPRSALAFVATRPGHWLLDLYSVGRQRLAACGVASVHGGAHCTHSEPALFYSYRRDRAVERMAACIWRV